MWKEPFPGLRSSVSPQFPSSIPQAVSSFDSEASGGVQTTGTYHSTVMLSIY